MVKFGFFLILIALAILGMTLASVVSPNDTSLLDLLEPVVCAPGENLIQQVVPSSRSVDNGLLSFAANNSFFCKPTTGALIDVTNKLFATGFTASLVALVFGLIFLFTGIVRGGSRSRRPAVVGAPATAAAYPTHPGAAGSAYATQVGAPRQPNYGGGYSAAPAYSAPPARPPQAPAPSEKFDFDSAATMMSIPKAAPAPPPEPATQVRPAAGGTDLAKRLAQLRDALDAGLISQEEFDRSKSNLLHDFTDDD